MENSVYLVEQCARKVAPIRSPTGIRAGLGEHLALIEHPDKIPIGDRGSSLKSSCSSLNSFNSVKLVLAVLTYSRSIIFNSGFGALSDLVSLVAPTPGALSPVCADLLPPRNRVRGFVSATDSEASLEESYKSYIESDIDFDVQADIDACIAATDAIAAREADVIVKTEDEFDEEAESSARGTVEIGVDRVTHPRGLDVVMQELYDHMVELLVHRVSVIESVQRDQGHRIMATSQQSAAMSERIGMLEWDNMRLRGMLGVEKQRVDRLWHSMSYAQRDLRQIHRFCFYDRVRIMTITSSGMIPAAIEELISQRVEEELAAQEANCNVGLIDENQSQNGDDNDNGSGGNGNQGNNNGDGNQNGKMENDKIKRFIWGLPDNIQGNVTSSKPVRLQDAIRMAIGLMDQKVYMYAGRNVEQKRKFNNNPRGNRVQQPPFKRQNVAQVVTVGKNERRGYARSAPYCKKCILHHEGPCTNNLHMSLC
ncbi:hypothetical protein Tco_0648656 [Tanacetum coccineum]